MYKLLIDQKLATSTIEKNLTFLATIKRNGVFQEVEISINDLLEAEISLYNYFAAPRLNTPILMQYVGGIDEKVKTLKRLFEETYDPTSHFDVFTQRNKELSDFMQSTVGHLPWVLKNNVASDILSLEVKGTLGFDDLKEWAIKTVDYVHGKYQSNNKDSYLDLFGIDYERLILKDCIHKSCVEDSQHTDPYCVAKCSIDVNGLKTICDYGEGGHGAGRELLQHVSQILRGGRTTRFLESLGIRVYPFAEGGDEYGLVLSARKDIRPALETITELYLAEMERTDVDYLLDFDKEEVKMLFRARNIEVSAFDKFILSCGFGWTVLGDVLENYEFVEENLTTSYTRILNDICSEIFMLSDESCIKHKSDFKKSLLANGKEVLYSMYTIRTDVNYIISLQDKIRELEELNNQLKDRLVSLADHETARDEYDVEIPNDVWYQNTNSVEAI